MARLIGVIIVLLLVVTAAVFGKPGDRPHPQRARAIAFRKLYEKVTGTLLGNEQRIDWGHFDTTPEGEISYVFPKKKGSPEGTVHGPIRFFFQPRDTQKILPYEFSFPSEVYAVLGDAEIMGIGPTTHVELESIIDVHTVKLTNPEDIIAAYTFLKRGLPFKPVTVQGDFKTENDGTNFPWWSWALTNPQVIPQHSFKGETATPIVANRDPKAWSDSQPGKFSSEFPIVALTDGDGRVFSGYLDMGDLKTPKELPVSKWVEPKNRRQQFARSIFAEHPQISQHHDTVFANFQSQPSEPVEIELESEGKIQRLTSSDLETIFVEAVGMPKGDHANPNYQLRLTLKPTLGGVLTVMFQNNLPSIEGRAIAYQKNRPWVSNYQEPIMVWFGPPPDPNVTQRMKELHMAPYAGSPVDEGTLKVSAMKVDSMDGLLNSLDADVSFTTVLGDRLFKGRMRIRFPDGSLNPWDSTYAAKRGLNILRSGMSTKEENCSLLGIFGRAPPQQ